MATQRKLSEILAERDAEKQYVSFEFFPPKTEKGEQTLIDTHMAHFAHQQPLFIDFTWGAGGTTSDKTPAMCLASKDKYGLTVNMHLTCTNMAEGKVNEALEFCKKNGIRNIVALRGDPPAGQQWQQSAEGFASALDLVRYIRKNYGDYFSVCVAGYPEGHPDKIGTSGVISDEEMEAELAYLEKKVEAGADCVITQLFYNVDRFITFVKRSRERGIVVPILPGILPIVSYAGLQRMISLCKTELPSDVRDKVETLKDDEAGLKQFGVELATDMCRRISSADIGTNHFHFYTLNTPHSTMEVLKNLGLYTERLSA
jgi:methylenetetrahydrofolate reductase (NADPH)